MFLIKLFLEQFHVMFLGSNRCLYFVKSEDKSLKQQQLFQITFYGAVNYNEGDLRLYLRYPFGSVAQ